MLVAQCQQQLPASVVLTLHFSAGSYAVVGWMRAALATTTGGTSGAPFQSFYGVFLQISCNT
jgi:hypothetical protein